jgi:hypothetical protein
VMIDCDGQRPHWSCPRSSRSSDWRK